MDTYLLISPPYLKQNSTIENNVEDKLLMTSIEVAQRIHIEDVLGTNLYNAIISKLENNLLVGDYLTLVDKYVIPAIVKWSYFYALDDINFKNEQSGVVTKNDEYSTAIDLETIKYRESKAKDVAQFYTQKVSNYLCANSSLFVEFKTENEVDETSPRTTNYSNGLYLRKK